MIVYLEAVDGTTGFGRVGHVVLRRILAQVGINSPAINNVIYLGWDMRYFGTHSHSS